MKTVDLNQFDRPMEIFTWMCTHWGPPGLNDRWDLRELTYLDLTNESDLTFLLLKWNLKKHDTWNTK
jgi:hypothetical protein